MEYLIANPPRVSQYRNRRKRPTGAIELHSAENTPDVRPPDTGAENVARFIRDRTDHGSYHSLVDSDTRIRLIPFHLTAFGDGTGFNDTVIHISGAFKAHQFATLPQWWKSGCIRNMALEARDATQWLKAIHGIVTPPRRITIAQARNGMSGYFTHGMSDPTRRSDPDNTHTGDKFPWDEFFSYLTEEDDDVKAEDIEAIANAVWGRRLVYKGAGLDAPAELAIGDIFHHARLGATSNPTADIDELAIAQEILNHLDPSKIAAAIPDNLASRVADELAARLGN